MVVSRRKKLRKAKLRKASDADIAYAIVNCVLDGKLNGLENSKNLNPLLKEACQKIAALKIGLTCACKLGKFDEAQISRLSLEVVRRGRPKSLNPTERQ
jgi:hypothetical protein